MTEEQFDDTTAPNQDAEPESEPRKPTTFNPEQLGPYRWSHPSVPKLDSAMAAAQGDMRNATENRTNTHLNSKYADLGSVIVAVREACSRHGIARYQVHWTDMEGNLILTTRIAHAGEWVEADFLLRVETLKGLKMLQMVGNALTYAKRYALTSMLGIASGEDDDGESTPEPEPDRQTPESSKWQTAVQAYAKVGVKPPQILAFLDRRSVSEIDDEDYKTLQNAYKAIQGGDKGRLARFKPAQ